MNRYMTLPQLIEEAGRIAEQVRADYGALSPAQLNWKPSPNDWSVGQCFDHLLIANGSYFPVFERMLDPARRASLLERLPLLPGLWGGLLISMLDPANPGRGGQAPVVFRPTSSAVPAGIVGHFLEQQQRLVGCFEQHRSSPLDRVIVTSPAAGFVTYSALDACRIIVVHEQHHLVQIAAVTRVPGFPAA
ncbi:MAG: hypothetical protein OHK0022_51540 [Roseiflexaceae bacterium]